MTEVSRRSALGIAASAAAAGVIGVRTPASAAEGPPGFPQDVRLYREVFQNWDGVVRTDPLWTCAPRSPGAVAEVVNWAHAKGYAVRPRGYRHSWSPLVADESAKQDDAVVLVDTTRHLTSMTMLAPDEVRAQTGVRMDALLEFLHRNGRAITNAPAPGDVTLGGVLAVSGHGTSVPAEGERVLPGQSFGSLSNLVTSLTAIVWDEHAGRYTQRRFDRADPRCAALLTNLGRAFVTEVTLRVIPDYQLRCQCHTDIAIDELFAHPDRVTERSLTKLLEDSGRVGLIWYAFTEHPWVQRWTRTPERPILSRPVLGPYNFPFADNLPSPIPQLIGRMVAGNDWIAPEFGATMLQVTNAGLTATGAWDMWGWAKDFIHFVKPTTLRVSAGSHAVVTARKNVQRVVHEFSEFITATVAKYREKGQYPLNNVVEMRVTGIDTPDESIAPGALAPTLSAASPIAGKPEWDTVIWLDALCLPGTPHEFEFFTEVERFIRRNYAGYARVRPEWSKRWATTGEGAWTDQRVFREVLPASFDHWDSALSTLAELDPGRVYRNALIDRIMPPG